MLEYKLSPKAEKYIKKLKDQELKRRFREAMKKIRNDPGIGQPKKGDLAGAIGYDVYYNATNYEVAYMIIENSLVIFVLIGPRENFYNELRLYIKKYL